MMRWIAVVVAVALAQQTSACIAPDFEDHHYPSCTIPEPQDEHRVSLLVPRTQTSVADHHVGNPDRRTDFVVVEVAESNETHFLVLSAWRQTIWQFQGAVESIDRVVVLGAHADGPHAAGVIGVPAYKVSFTSPDMSFLDDVRVTSCTRIFRSCAIGQWFGDGHSDRVTLHPTPSQGALRHDAMIDGPRFSHWFDEPPEPIRLILPDDPSGVIAIDPQVVVSPASVLPYDQMPGQPGLDALVAEGALLPADAPEAQTIIASYAETFSDRYRTRFDPDFLFTPDINYVVTREVVLPPELRQTALMVANGVPAPDMNGNKGSTVCYYLGDQASEGATGDVVRSPRCRVNTIARAVGDGEVILDGASGFDRNFAGTTGDCSVYPLSEDVHVVAVALSAGDHRRHRGDPFRRVDIEVTRDGPTALHLSLDDGPIYWNVSGGNIVEIFGSRAGMQEMMQVTLNGARYEAKRLKHQSAECDVSGPLWPNRFGPHVAHLDFAFEALTGRALDRFIVGTVDWDGTQGQGEDAPVYYID